MPWAPRKYSIDYPGDVKRIVDVMWAKGWYVTPEDAQEAWRQRSEAYCASWLTLPEDDQQLFDEVDDYFD